jgi:5'(3')-deoxyribonucleotidase
MIEKFPFIPERSVVTTNTNLVLADNIMANLN